MRTETWKQASVKVNGRFKSLEKRGNQKYSPLTISEGPYCLSHPWPLDKTLAASWDRHLSPLLPSPGWTWCPPYWTWQSPPVEIFQNIRHTLFGCTAQPVPYFHRTKYPRQFFPFIPGNMYFSNRICGYLVLFWGGIIRFEKLQFYCLVWKIYVNQVPMQVSKPRKADVRASWLHFSVDKPSKPTTDMIRRRSGREDILSTWQCQHWGLFDIKETASYFPKQSPLFNKYKLPRLYIACFHSCKATFINKINLDPRTPPRLSRRWSPIPWYFR